MGRLIIDGKRVYEVDELCLKRKKNQAANRSQKNQGAHDRGHTRSQEHSQKT